MATPTTLPASFVAGNVLTAAQMNDLRGAFRVLQVVQTVKTDTFTTSSTSFTDVTGMSVSVTPSSTNSKILVYVDLRTSGNNAWMFKLLRGSTDIYLGDAASTRIRAFSGMTDELIGQNATGQVAAIFLDSPATTSATTYKIQTKTEIGTAMFINRTKNDPDNTTLGIRTASSITVMEISA